ncbi:MAG: FAD-binding oxidoreductase [bacterium]|nr:FAD-binding oxidoreductase [bacterium]
MLTDKIRYSSDQSIIQPYLTDESSAFRGNADYIFFPENESELSEIISSASKNQSLVTVSGGGTGITGSRVPVLGGSIISTEKITDVSKKEPFLQQGFIQVKDSGYSILINKEEKRAVVPPSLPLSVLNDILKNFDLSYPPDPTEMSATIGGTVSTNASGARSYYYGATRNWIKRIRVVLPDGSVTEIKDTDQTAQNGILKIQSENINYEIKIPARESYPVPEIKNAAGLYLSQKMRPLDLFIGCEGILGVFSDIEIALINRIKNTFTIVAFFEDKKGAVDFVDFTVTNKKIMPLISLEYFDFNSLEFLKTEQAGIPEKAQAAILFEFIEDGNQDDLLYKIVEKLEEYSVITTWDIPESKSDKIKSFRHILPEKINSYVKSRCGKVGTDIAVPHNKFSLMFQACETESLNTGLKFLVFGHIGNDHLHINYLPENNSEHKTAMRTYLKLAKLAVKMGGTISAEHGVGKKYIELENGTTVPCLEIMYGKTGINLISDIKKHFDPGMILNTGNIIPPA